MAVTAGKTLIRKRYDNMRQGIYNVALWLNDNLNDETGPGWTVVECDDTVTRAVPAGGTFATAGNNWVSGSGPPPAGSWCVLESLDGNNTNHCQFYIQLVSDSAAGFRIIPLEDFATGGGSTGGADPTFPATTVGAGSGEVSFGSFTSTGWFNAVADEGMVVIVATNSMDDEQLWTYMGECIPFHEAAGDDRCYVIWDLPTEVGFNDSGGVERWNRLSPADDSTILTRGETTHIVNSTPTSQPGGSERGNRFSSDVIWPAGVFFEDAGHIHDAGWLRNVFSVNYRLGSEGTIGPNGAPSFYFINSALTNAIGSVCITWDGVTRV